jgi:glycosyltransferase involved in cell wall biosynthesis
MKEWPPVRLALVVTGGVDQSGRDKVIPAILWLVERLAREHEVFVYALRYHRQPCSYPLLGATVRDLGRPSGLRRQYASLLAALRHDGPFEVIHAYWALPAGLVAAAAARRLGVPSVITCDSGEFTAIPDIDYGLRIRLRHRLAVAAALKLASRVTVCTAYMERLAREQGFSPIVIPIGVDTAIFHPGGPEGPLYDSGGPKGPAYHPGGPQGRPYRLLNVASLNPVKDHRTLIEAVRLVADRMGVHLHLAGEDTMNGAIQDVVRGHKLEAHVTFHGVLPSDHLAPLYRSAGLFVQSSRHEAAGIAVLEAAASGLPVVGTAVGHVADWAPLGAAAVPPGNPRALADAITELLTDPAEREWLARSARERAVTHDADWTAIRFSRLYADLV